MPDLQNNPNYPKKREQPLYKVYLLVQTVMCNGNIKVGPHNVLAMFYEYVTFVLYRFRHKNLMELMKCYHHPACVYVYENWKPTSQPT